MRKKILSGVLALALSLSLVPSVALGVAATGSPGSNGFTDVPPEAWYASDVADVQKYGLIDGVGNNRFEPLGELSLAQAITLASRTYALLNGETIVGDGSVWYQPYVDYADWNGLCARGEFGTNYNEACTRLTMAVLFERAFPSETDEEINSVSSLPDLQDEGNAQAVFFLYRQGVLTGNDQYGTFCPDKSITRAETSAILNRVLDMSKRQTFTLETPAPAEPAPVPADTNSREYMESQINDFYANIIDKSQWSEEYHGFWDEDMQGYWVLQDGFWWIYDPAYDMAYDPKI